MNVAIIKLSKIGITSHLIKRARSYFTIRLIKNIPVIKTKGIELHPQTKNTDSFKHPRV
jgi:hypothetical protein